MMLYKDPAPRFGVAATEDGRPIRFVEAPPDWLQHINLRLLYSEGGKLVKLHCPSHADGAEPNFVIYPSSAHCHACGHHETAVAHISRVCATRTHAEMLSVAVQLLQSDVGPANPSHVVTSKTLDVKMVREYMAALEGSTDLRAYLWQRYGLNPDTQRAAELGYASAVDAYTIPVLDRAGDVVNIRYRTHKLGGKMKYWGTANHSQTAWYFTPGLTPYPGTLAERVYACYKARLVLITEGELDALALYQLGLPAISSTGGAQSLISDTPQNCALIEELRGLQVILAYDQDGPGRTSAQSVGERMMECGLTDVRILQWDTLYGKDASELLAKGATLQGFRSICRMKRVSPKIVENNLTLHNSSVILTK